MRYILDIAAYHLRVPFSAASVRICIQKVAAAVPDGQALNSGVLLDEWQNIDATVRAPCVCSSSLPKKRHLSSDVQNTRVRMTDSSAAGTASAGRMDVAGHAVA